MRKTKIFLKHFGILNLSAWSRDIPDFRTDEFLNILNINSFAPFKGKMNVPFCLDNTSNLTYKIFYKNFKLSLKNLC